MATAARPVPKAGPLAPTAIEYALAVGATAMLAAVTAALLRGHGDWGRLHPVVWFHIVSIGVALILTPVMLLRARGDRRHRTLGTIWLVAMASTALARPSP